MRTVRYEDLAPTFFRFPKMMDGNLLRADFITGWLTAEYAHKIAVWKRIVPGSAAILVGKIRTSYDDTFFCFTDHSIVLVDGEVWLAPHSSPLTLVGSSSDVW